MMPARSTTPVFDVVGDARRAFDVLAAGGIAVVPNDIGYSALGGSPEALELIFRTKGRAPQKLNAMVADLETHRDLHECSERGRRIVETIVLDYGLPLGCIAPFRTDHPLMTSLPAEVVAASTRENTLVMLLNAGRFHAELTRLARENDVALFGSSANLTLGGTKFRVEDIEREIIDVADIVVDHGLQKYHPYGSSSTLLNVETLEVVRRGSCFPDIAYILERHFGEDIGR
ncbi:Sua5/YciO/YrdC/YwlC family protein [Microbacterium sp. SLBN-146]|uniref:Sua5/YciO/YrdC/YwlC family protein n=1 Tax=Microbacterium sp. SLBN-146 TaxID=2768457 RepID=UPI001168745D|nr:Sua5/YciO/YrdC/YwlC family protein [Microbacterium sp. SLBN-146]TQJ29919.1 tRNA A37 threonylcarbamoyladenosine synthetase subunit TsaC/SUA5/YrdC [Microbacterium sp. SLBN-146]